MIHNLKNRAHCTSVQQKHFSAYTLHIARFLHFLKRSGYVFGLSRTKRFFVFALIIIPFGTLHAFTLPFNASTQTLSHVTTTTQTVIQLREPLVFTFDTPQYDRTITATASPQTPLVLTWNNEHTTLTIAPQEAWHAATTYTIALTEQFTTSPRPSSFFVFHTINFPKVLTTTPRDGASRITIGEETEISVTFDRDLTGFYIIPRAENFTIADVRVNKKEKTFSFSLRGAITQPTTVRIDFDAYALDDPTSITSLGGFSFDAVPAPPKEWPKDPNERLRIAAYTTRPQITTGKYIDINLDARITTLFENGVVVNQFINSPGAQDTPTITGTFKIENKARRPLSEMFGVYLPYWMAFTPDGKYGFHDLIEWPPNHPDFPDSPRGGKESLQSIDKAVSPGCVRHNTSDSMTFYQWAEIGTPVIIYK